MIRTQVVNYKHWLLTFDGGKFSCGIIASKMSVMKIVGLATSKTGFGAVESVLQMWEDRLVPVHWWAHTRRVL